MGEGRIQELDTSKYDEITAVFNPKSKIQNPKSKIKNRAGGGVWESNPPEHALAYSQTVLKTAPITGQDAPPKKESRFRIELHSYGSGYELEIRIEVTSAERFAISPIKMCSSNL